MNEPNQQEWEKILDLILGLAPEGTLKYDRNQLIKETFRELLSSHRASLIKELEGKRRPIPEPFSGDEETLPFNKGIEAAIALLKRENY